MDIPCLFRFFIFFGSWNGFHNFDTKTSPSTSNATNKKSNERRIDILLDRLASILRDKITSNSFLSLSAVLVDSSNEEEFEICIGDDYFKCPSTLPSLALVGTNSFNTVVIEHCKLEPNYLISLSRIDAAKDHHFGDSNNNVEVSKKIDDTIALVLHKLASSFSNANSFGTFPSSSVPATTTTTTTNTNTGTSMETEIKMNASSKTDESKKKKIAKSILELSTTTTALKDKEQTEAIRIFISGNRSQVGKSSVCIGLLGNLLAPSFQYKASDLAYIKPATQCEATHLVAEYCKMHNIDAIPIGPVVYYKGFTRAFLSGKAQYSSDELLDQVSEAVDKLSIGKKVVIIDGVGYPSVGSITGTCNASVAQASGYLSSKSGEGGRIPVPVILVGKSGVGDAIDSYNINATYFQNKNVAVLGAIFNRLKMEGYYSLENCKQAVTAYFDKFKENQRAFGFVPELPSISNARSESDDSKIKSLLEAAEEFVKVFGKYVDMNAIIKAATEVKMQAFHKRDESKSVDTLSGLSVSKQKYLETTSCTLTSNSRRNTNASKSGVSNEQNVLTREQIEMAAAMEGAAAG